MPPAHPAPPPRFFATAHDFRAWLQAHSATGTELQVGYWKVGTGRPSMSWPESVDQALCFGWIDGVRRRIDDLSYQIRFTPRSPQSTWSAVNIAKYEQLCAQGAMTEAGRLAYARRREDKSAIYAYEQPAEAALTAAELQAWRRQPAAWAHFEACPAGYRKVVLHWISQARKPETRAARLARLIEASAQGQRLR